MSTGDEKVSQKKVIERLQAAKNVIKAKSGKTGTLVDLNKTLENLNIELFEALGNEKKKSEIQKQYEETVLEEEKLKKDYEINKLQYNIQEKLEEIQKLEYSISNKKYLDNLIEEYNSKKQKLVHGDVYLDGSYVKNFEDQLSTIQTLERIYEDYCNKLQFIEIENEQLKNEKLTEITDDCLKTIKIKDKERIELQKSIGELKNIMKETNEFNLEIDKEQKVVSESQKKLEAIIETKEKQQKQLEEMRNICMHADSILLKAKEDYDNTNRELYLLNKQKHKASADYQVAVNQRINVEQISKQKVDSAKERLKKASTPRRVVTEKEIPRSINKLYLSTAVIIFILSIILGVAVNRICFFVSTVSIVLAVAAINKKKTVQTETMYLDEEEVSRAESDLKSEENFSRREIQSACEDEESAQLLLKEFEDRAESLKEKVSKLENQYVAASKSLAKAKEEYSEYKVKLEFINEKLLEAEAEADCEKKQFDKLVNSNEASKNADIKNLQFELDEKLSKLSLLNDDILQMLMKVNCSNIDELQSKYTLWKSYLARSAAKSEEFERVIDAEKEAKNKLELRIKRLLDEIGIYIPVSSVDDVEKAVAVLKSTNEEINTIDIKISSQREFLKNEIQTKTIQELENHRNQLLNEVLSLNNGEMPAKYDSNKLQQMKQYDEFAEHYLNKTREKLIEMNSEIKNQFIGRRNISEIDSDISKIKEEIAEYQEYYDCVDIAETIINEAFNEISQSFGPLLNSKTSEIFNSLTGGKYENVIISRNFDINVQKAEDVVSHEWKYLSNGTVDQAYFALRLAISDLLSHNRENITENGIPLPLLLDDVFVQYDEGRAEQALKFLIDYSQKNNTKAQIIMFTCQKNIVEISNNIGIKENIKGILGDYEYLVANA